MDPEATLGRLRELVGEIEAVKGDRDAEGYYATEMAEAFGALDEWMKKGGFSPWRYEIALGRVRKSRELSS